MPFWNGSQLKDLANIYNSSDADADVLAEYVIALLKHDGDAGAVRKLCEQEIPDFLSEGAHYYSHIWNDCPQKLTRGSVPQTPRLSSTMSSKQSRTDPTSQGLLQLQRSELSQYSKL